MPTPTEFFLWRYTDDDGKRRTTTWRMDRVRALATLKDPEPVESSREVRNLPDGPDEYAHTSYKGQGAVGRK